MNLTVDFAALEAVRAEWLVVAAWENEGLPGPVAALDARLGGVLTRLRERGDVAGKANELTPSQIFTKQLTTDIAILTRSPKLPIGRACVETPATKKPLHLSTVAVPRSDG